MTPKKIPMRMCTGCGEMKPKRELIRVVRQKDGTILADFTGKAAGRGAYLCPRRSCFQQARKSRRLERSFSCRIAEEVYDAVERAIPEDTGGTGEGNA